MPRRSRLTLVLILLATSACAPKTFDRLVLRDERIGCAPNAACELGGVIQLQILPGDSSVATIDQARSSCVPLLVDAAVFRSARRWNDKNVRVTGTALPKVQSDEDTVLLQYRDRWLQPFVCGDSEIVLYVDRIALEE